MSEWISSRSLAYWVLATFIAHLIYQITKRYLNYRVCAPATPTRDDSILNLGRQILPSELVMVVSRVQSYPKNGPWV
jgi:hypothetical protein